MKVLVADIGGTKSRVGIADGHKVLVAHERQTSSKEELFKFLQHVQAEAKNARELRIGAAGPLLGDAIALTNGTFKLSKSELERQLKIPVQLCNDFVALGYVVNALGAKDYVTVQPGPLGEVIALVGPGTGLGMSILRKSEQGYIPLATEGSKAALPIRTAEEFALAQSIEEELGRPAEIEDAVSGPGLERIYRFLHHKHMTAPPGLAAADISATYAFNRCSRETLHLFARLLARTARDAVLMNGAFGGVVIAGGVARRNLHIFDEQFRAIFAHGTFEEVMSELPLRIIVRPHAGLLGAAAMPAARAKSKKAQRRTHAKRPNRSR